MPNTSRILSLSVVVTATLSCSFVERGAVPENLIGSYGRSVDSCYWSDQERYACSKEKIRDYLIITRNSDPTKDEALHVRMELHFFNGHTCSLDYPASWNSGRLEVIDGFDDYGKAFCSLDLDVAKDRITIHDNDVERCSMIHCGTRGMLDGATLLREDESRWKQ